MKKIASITMVSALLLASAGLLMGSKANRDNENKNVICHVTGVKLSEDASEVVYKGNVIAVSDKALDAHLAHGDSEIGASNVELGAGGCQIHVPLPQ